MRELTHQNWPSSLTDKLVKSAMVVAMVAPGSPAEHMGISPGWEVLQLNGAPPTFEGISAARRRPLRDVHFRDPATGNILGLGPGAFPLGLKVIPMVTAEFKDALAARAVPQKALHAMWNLGNWKDFAGLVPALESALLPFGTKILGRFASARVRADKIMAADNYVLLQFLSLGYLAQGDASRAITLLEQAAAAHLRMGDTPQPNQHWGLGVFIRALAAFAEGDAATALRLADEGALHYGHDCRGLLRLYGQLSGRGDLVSVHKGINQPFAGDYSLPQSDPFQQWPSPGTPVALQASLAAMQPGQLLCIYALGPYRTNGPMQDEMAGLMALHAHDPGRFAAIHLITAHDLPPGHWRANNQIEDQARALGLPISVLFDADDSFGAARMLDSFPTLYVLDHHGILRATEPMADEDAWWLALARTVDDDAGIAGT